jgi:signal transduction histidine kinase
MLALLVGAALVVYIRLRIDLDDRVNDDLHARAALVASRLDEVELSELAPGDPEESLLQVVTPGGRMLESVGGVSGGAPGPVLTTAQAAAAAVRPMTSERRVPGKDGVIRIYARSAGSTANVRVVVVGHSLVDRNEALASIVRSFTVGGGLAVLLTTLSGYLIARAGLAPVEAMRRRAGEVSLNPTDGGLPLPAARDEIRRLGETLNQMLVRLRESFARESRFAADASHELRTPIAVVKTELEAALQAGDHGPVTRESLVAAVEECDRLAQLAEDLLLVARAAGGKLPMRPEQVWAWELLDGVRARFIDRARQRGRTITVDAGDGERIYVDPVRIRQALSNLVDNAIRHGGGDVVLRERHVRAAVLLEVHDHGAGFPAEFAAQAFDRFSRGDPGRSGDGSGLGLAIVAAIAEAHGGAVTITPGTGTTVQVLLPAGSAPDSAARGLAQAGPTRSVHG